MPSILTPTERIVTVDPLESVPPVADQSCFSEGAKQFLHLALLIAVSSLRGGKAPSSLLLRSATVLPQSFEDSFLQLWNKELSAKVLEVEKVRLEARNLDEDQVEIVLHDKQQLQLDLEKLKRLQAEIQIESFG